MTLAGASTAASDPSSAAESQGKASEGPLARQLSPIRVGLELITRWKEKHFLGLDDLAILATHSPPIIIRKKGTIMYIKKTGAVLLLQIAFGLSFVAAANTQVIAPRAGEIDSDVTAALSSLYAHNEAARALGAKAIAVLVFPSIKKAAFIVGAQYGYGALRQGGRTSGYYRTSAASYGFQVGVKAFGYAMFFMTPSALNYLEKSHGWAIGTGPSLVVVDQGLARSLTTTSLRSDVYAFVFDQKGLMGGIGLEGSKITEITAGN